MVERLKPAFTKQGHEILGHFVSELATNDVPQLLTPKQIASALASGTISALTGLVAIDFYYTKPGELSNFTKFF